MGVNAKDRLLRSQCNHPYLRVQAEKLIEEVGEDLKANLSQDLCPEELSLADGDRDRFMDFF